LIVSTLFFVSSIFFPAPTDETPFSKQDSIIGPEGVLRDVFLLSSLISTHAV
jgi:hypothetical protein